MVNNDAVKLDAMLKAVLSVASEDQNFFYSPRVYQDQYRTVTSLLITKLAKLYPSEQWVIDALEPFIEKTLIPVKNGVIELPDNYRNLLGAPQVAVKNDKSGECSDIPVIDTKREFDLANLRGRCEKRPIIIVEQSDFAYRTTSNYDPPTHWNPIGYFSGKRQITICPYDIGKVEVMFVKNETPVVYGYITQPDDTFIFDAATSTETQWTNAAFDYLFKALVFLYSAYAKDSELRDWTALLTQSGVL